MQSDKKLIKDLIRSNQPTVKKGPPAGSSLKNQKGAAAIEYAVIAALIVVALWGAVEALDLETSLSSIFTSISDALAG